MLRMMISAWRERRLAFAAEALARQLGPHLARDIGLAQVRGRFDVQRHRFHP